MATLAVGLVLAAAALAISGAFSGGGAEWSRANPASLPNIILIQTDDQTLASLDRKTMPRTMRLLADRGTRFANHAVASPLCCPSRASLLTGQYPHNHGIAANLPGYPALGEKRNTLPAWLQRAGYRTAHVGKYMNHWNDFVDDPAKPPPGWSDWLTMVPPYGYFDYELTENGEIVRYGDARGDYLTTVLNRHARRLVAEQLPRRRPLFLALDQLAPHGQSIAKGGRCANKALPLPGDLRRFAREPLPRSPSFDERDLGDKPGFRQLVDRLSPSRIRSIRRNHRCRLATLRAVDRGVGRIHSAVERAGQLDRTVFIFTSDNGFMQGEHRIPAQKAQPFEEAVRAPLLIRVPKRIRAGAERVGRLDAASSNIDLAPTILELARARPCRSRSRCRTLDGRSLLGPLTGSPTSWPDERATLISFASGHRKNSLDESCSFFALRTPTRVFVEHRSLPDPADRVCRPALARELYDLERDPHQLENLAPGDAAAQEDVDPELRSRLVHLELCAGIAGRDDRVGGRPYCE